MTNNSTDFSKLRNDLIAKFEYMPRDPKYIPTVYKLIETNNDVRTIFYDKMLYGEYLSYLNECGYFGEDRHNDDKGFEDYMKSNGESSSSEYEKFKNLYYTKFANDSDDSILNVNDKDNEDKYDELNF